MKDAEFAKAFSVYAKKKGFFWEQLHTYMLIQKKQYEKAVKLYGPKDDYNIGSRTNKVLMATFGGADRGDVDIKKIKLAIEDFESGMRQMLTDTRHYESLRMYPPYMEALHKKFPIQNFAA